MSCCIPINCASVCECINLTSSNGTVNISKLGCTWDITADSISSDITFDPDTRDLCVLINDVPKCVNIPDKDDQYITFDEETFILSIHNGDGEIISSVNLSIFNTEFSASSTSLVITPGGTFGHEPNIEIVPSVDAGNALILGSDGRPYVPPGSTPEPETPNSEIDTDSIAITLTGTLNRTISANLRIDPSSTAPISITSDGLKIDCCDTPPIVNVCETADSIHIIEQCVKDESFIYVMSKNGFMYKVKPSTGLSTRIGSLSSSHNALALHPDGYLYYFIGSKFRKMSLDGSVTIVAEPLGLPTSPYAATFDSEGIMYVISSTGLYRITGIIPDDDTSFPTATLLADTSTLLSPTGGDLMWDIDGTLLHSHLNLTRISFTSSDHSVVSTVTNLGVFTSSIPIDESIIQIEGCANLNGTLYFLQGGTGIDCKIFEFNSFGSGVVNIKPILYTTLSEISDATSSDYIYS